MCPEVADEADPGIELASLGVAHVGRLVGLCRGHSALSAFLWLLCSCCSLLISVVDETTPDGAV